MLEIIYKKRELLTSLTFLRYRQTPIYLKRVKAHAERREPSTFVLDRFCQFWRFSETRIKADASQYVCYIICYVTIRSFCL